MNVGYPVWSGFFELFVQTIKSLESLIRSAKVWGYQPEIAKFFKDRCKTFSGDQRDLYILVLDV